MNGYTDTVGWIGWTILLFLLASLVCTLALVKATSHHHRPHRR